MIAPCLLVLVACQEPVVSFPEPPGSSASVHEYLREAVPAPEADVSRKDLLRLLDLVEIDGVRSNQLLGVGVVVGLPGTGDSGGAARQALSNFIRKFELNLLPRDVTAGSIALVSVTADLEAFQKNGMRIPVKVSTLGDAKSLFGGELLQTPLLGADGLAYVVAQGPVVVGGFQASGQAASVTRNHPTVGLITDGGIVEREVPMVFMTEDGLMHLHLRRAHFLTAHRVAESLNRLFPESARALDSTTVRFEVPEARRFDPVGLIAQIGQERIEPAAEAIVVVNERTGTIVAGQEVRISPTAITHGNLTIAIAESPLPSQPLPYSKGETTVVPQTDVQATVDSQPVAVLDGGTSVNELAASLNRLGVSSRDLVLIFQALQAQGALHARLEIL